MSIVVMVLSFIGLMRYQTEPFRQSLFENFIKNYHTSVEFCAIFSIFNIYIYTLAFVYSPAKSASIGKFIFFFYDIRSFYTNLELHKRVIFLVI